MYQKFGIKKEILDLSEEVEKEIQPIFKNIEKIEEINSLKVLSAFQECGLSEMHLNSSTGYGIDEIGRNKIEEIYAKIFNAEDALVRAQLISGTHALAVTLFGILRPGDTMLSISGAPYDTLQTAIGISKEESKSSLKAFGVKYEQIELIDNDFDINSIKERVSKKDIKLIEIQRSKGYSTRKSLTIDKIEKAIKSIREVNKDVIIMVDNCYGEFVEEKEPTDVGADILVGSLMKNLGAGIATSGAYIVGKKDLIELCAERLTAPGVGKEIGPSLNQNILFIKGLFFAPSVVSSSLKSAILISKVMDTLGYRVSPKWDQNRCDIVNIVYLKNEESLINFTKLIQASGPVDASVEPVPSDMPGYTDKVIMASPSFTQGSSIEMSCDAPLRSPYALYIQGGLTYNYAKLALINVISNLKTHN